MMRGTTSAAALPIWALIISTLSLLCCNCSARNHQATKFQSHEQPLQLEKFDGAKPNQSSSRRSTATSQAASNGNPKAAPYYVHNAAPYYVHNFAMLEASGLFSGAEADVSIWCPHVRKTDAFRAKIALSNEFNRIEAGFQVMPRLYRDKTPMARIYISLSFGSFWVFYIGTPSILSVVGWWTAEAFLSDFKVATHVEFGGEVETLRGQNGKHNSPPTEMGSGYFPSAGWKKASYFRDLGVNGVDNTPLPLHDLMMLKNNVTAYRCYDLKRDTARSFYYGGTGKDCP